MSGILKALLLLTVLACITKAQRHRSNRCLCNRVEALKVQKTQIKDIHIYPATIFCTRVEIVVTTNNNNRFCLDPELKKVKRLMDKIISSNRKSSTSAPTALSSASTSKITTQA